MSFKDRLERLHDSRRRQKERDEAAGGKDEDSPSVFYADDVEEASADDDDTADASAEGHQIDKTDPKQGGHNVSRETSASGSDNAATDTPQTSQPGESHTEKSRGEVYQKLERSYSMRQKSRSTNGSTDRRQSGDPNADPGQTESRETAHRETVSPTTHSKESRAPTADDVGTRVAELRRQARDAIDRGDWEAAAPRLHEIVALMPNHPYALEQLATYHERRDEPRAAERYRERLEQQSPFGN